MNLALDLTAAEFPDGRIVLRPQGAPDQAKLLRLVPSDRERTAVLKWDGGTLVVDVSETSPALPPPAPGTDDKLARSMAELNLLSQPDLMDKAAMLGVKWNAHVSKETMLERIAKAGMK